MTLESIIRNFSYTKYDSWIHTYHVIMNIIYLYFLRRILCMLEIYNDGKSLMYQINYF